MSKGVQLPFSSFFSLKKHKMTKRNYFGKAAPEAGKTKKAAWDWWRKSSCDLNPRHAVKIFESAGELEALVLDGGPPLDRRLQGYQRANKKMGKNDRALLAEALYHFARNRKAYRLALPDARPGDGKFLILALLEIMGAEKPGKVPHLPGGVSVWLHAIDKLEELRKSWKKQIEKAWSLPVDKAASSAANAFEGLFSLPWKWLEIGPWPTVGDAALELYVLKRPQKLILRVQPHKASRDEILDALKDLGVSCGPTQMSPWGIVVHSRQNVLASDIFKNGFIEVQDEGSQLAALFCDPKPGERILDLCAGGGGKTLALASAMKGRGTVMAYDPERNRLLDTRQRAKRGGLENVRILKQSEDVEKLAPYDQVLVDAPCSSSGTLRRNPDVAWRWKPDDIERLKKLQAEILDRAAQLVKPGGFIIYATCSLFEPENSRQIEAFLKRTPDMELAPPGDRQAHEAFSGITGADKGMFRLPANLDRYSGDGFFVARMKRDK